VGVGITNDGNDMAKMRRLLIPFPPWLTFAGTGGARPVVGARDMTTRAQMLGLYSRSCGRLFTQARIMQMTMRDPRILLQQPDLNLMDPSSRGEEGTTAEGVPHGGKEPYLLWFGIYLHLVTANKTLTNL
jgi:hypothetical protein